jgi:hypothetical protein
VILLVEEVKRQMQYKRTVFLVGGSFEGWKWNIYQSVTIKGKVSSFNFTFVDPFKAKTRRLDKQWIAYNIPSSLWWKLDMHHNWEDGGRMYLLTPKEHKERDKQ